MMPEVVNPAVIIGFGGTGKWVLTYVKKNLLGTYGGEMPKTVRLLSFDTTSEKISRDGVPQEEDARVGYVQLDKQAEFVYWAAISSRSAARCAMRAGTRIFAPGFTRAPICKPPTRMPS